MVCSHQNTPDRNPCSDQISGQNPQVKNKDNLNHQTDDPSKQHETTAAHAVGELGQEKCGKEFEEGHAKSAISRCRVTVTKVQIPFESQGKNVT